MSRQNETKSEDDLDLLTRLKMTDAANEFKSYNLSHQRINKKNISNLKKTAPKLSPRSFNCSYILSPDLNHTDSKKYKRQARTGKHCSKTFNTLKQLKTHKISHISQRTEETTVEEPDYKFDEIQDLYICNVCSAEFQEENETQQHIRIHQELIACQGCTQTFKNYFELGIHSIIHDPEKKVKCPLCQYVSSNSNPYSFKAHMNYVHLKQFPFYCKECGKGFKHCKTYQEHQNTHIGKKPYICVVCQKAFTYQKYMHVHQARNHQVGITGKRIENECRTCNRYFYRPEALEEHIDVCYKRKKKPKGKTPAKAFLCDTCGKTFTEKAKLLDHIRVHKGDLPYVCSWCGKRFPVKSYLKTHERVHTGEKPYSCEFCGKRFGQHAPFRVHRRTHTGERPYVCDFCSRGFTTNQGLKLHKKNCSNNQLDKRKTLDRHNKKTRKRKRIFNSDYIYTSSQPIKKSNKLKKINAWFCEQCHKTFKSKLLYCKHKLENCLNISKSLDQKEHFQCKYCTEMFDSQKSLRDHKKSHKADNFEESPSYKFDSAQDLYICEVCSAEYQKVTEVQKHIKCHVPDFKCQLCEQLFNTAFDLGMHSLKHSDDKKIKCPFCNYVSKKVNPYSFKCHLNYMHLKKFPFYCKECGKGFKQFKIYQDHQNSHSGEKPYVCIVCEKSFTFEKYLLVHQIRNHQVNSCDTHNENKCKICQKLFQNYEDLESHREGCLNKRRHFKKPNSFLCDTCGQGFIEKSKLLKHIRVHNGDLPFACSWCDKRFPQKDYLKTHERVHTGEKPYTCSFCGKCFGFHAPFRVHIRTHTGERPYKCDFCDKGFTTNQGLKLHKKNCPENQLNKMLNSENLNGESTYFNYSLI